MSFTCFLDFGGDFTGFTTSGGFGLVTGLISTCLGVGSLGFSFGTSTTVSLDTGFSIFIGALAVITWSDVNGATFTGSGDRKDGFVGEGIVG